VPAAAPAAAPASYYVSIGDSYAAGYQPSASGPGRTTVNGFAYQLVGLAGREGLSLKLVNFACSGATTASVLHTPGCPGNRLGPGAAPYSSTQASAAEAFIRAHRGRVRLITLSIGGNDLLPCALAPDPIACVGAALPGLETGLATLLQGLRASAGASAQIVGITYPDVVLGAWVLGSAEHPLAQLSVGALRDLLNPALSARYGAVGGQVVDVTAASGAYGPLTDTVDLTPYGVIPVPVARVCELTYFCDRRDVHPKTAGYTLIAELILGVLSRG